MKIIEKHYKNCATIVIGDYCSTGCHYFHKDQAQEFFEKYEVPENIRHDILNAFNDNGIITNFNDYPLYIRLDFARHYKHHPELLKVLLEKDEHTIITVIIESDPSVEILKQFINHDESSIREHLAKTGHYEILKEMVNDSSYLVRNIVASFDYSDLHKILMNDPVARVRHTILKKTTDKDIINHFYNDPEIHIRCDAVKKITDKDLLDKILTDSDPRVRGYLAIHNYPDHLEVLKNDPNPITRMGVGVLCDDYDILKQFVNDKSHHVKMSIILHNYIDLLEMLVNDDDIVISNMAKRRIKTIQEDSL